MLKGSEKPEQFYMKNEHKKRTEFLIFPCTGTSHITPNDNTRVPRKSNKYKLITAKNSLFALFNTNKEKYNIRRNFFWSKQKLNQTPEKL